MQILVITDFQKAIEKAKECLYEKVDKKTVLFLSGGTSPKSLYTRLAKDAIIRPAAVGMVDERYGKKLHDTSNERMMQDTGFLDYLTNTHVPFYPILPNHPRGVIEREKIAAAYDKTARDLFFHFPKSVAVMGIGTDGHIAGIAPEFSIFNFQFPIKKPKGVTRDGEPRNSSAVNEMNEASFGAGEWQDPSKTKNQFVISYKDPHMVPPERITMTFAGLALIDFFVVLAFGKEKKKPLQHMFSSGSLEEIPARFFMQQAPNNTVVITDQQI